jgi:hypothetical protein
MSLNISIPLSGNYLNIKGFYLELSNGKIIEDITSDWRLLGYNPSGYRGSPTAANYIPSRVMVNTIDIPIPIHRESLVSASLSFSFLSGVPFLGVDPEEARFIEDWRYPIFQDFRGTTNIPISLSTQSGQYVPVFDLSSAISIPKAQSNTIRINSQQNITLSLTNQLQYHTNKNNWVKNNRVVIFLSGLPSGNGGGGAISLSGLTLDLTYNPVPPFAPRSLIVSETAYKQVSMNWQPPLDNGGANISEYIIEYGFPSGNIDYVPQWYNAGSAVTNSFQINNLIVDQTYIFRVAGKNTAGQGLFSSQSLPITISKSNAPTTSLNFNDANYTRIRLRRATLSEWSGNNPILALGEAGYELDTKRLKVGDGVSNWNNLSYTRVDNSTIDFPKPPDVNLIVASSFNNMPNNDRIILNLSSGDRLNIIGQEGVNVEYSDTYQRLVISSDKLYNPVSFGTITNPTNSGVPGSLLYDNDWFYFCIQPNYWQRSPLDKTWLDLATTMISNNSGNYRSNTSLIFDKKILKIETDGDPYPALAGRPLVNDGVTSRTGFGQNSTIRDQNHAFILNYRGGTNTHNPMSINTTGIHGVMNNGVLVLSVSAGSGALPGFISAPSGFTYNAVANSTFFGTDDCGGVPDVNGIYTYRDGRFLKNCWQPTDKVYFSNTYYSGTNYSGNYFRHTNGHSKILGFCLDGYPIYGPYAYADSIDNTSIITRMTSSYSGLTTDSHRPINWKYWNTITVADISYSTPMGVFNQDFVYVSGYGHLDQFNGRYGITPDFPSGTYAYYLTFEDDALNIPAYPYIFGTGTKEQRALYSV